MLYPQQPTTKRTRRTRITNQTMANEEAGAGATGTEKEETMASVEDVVAAEEAKVAVVEEAEVATATTTM